MPKYLIEFNIMTSYAIPVEANSEEEASAKADVLFEEDRDWYEAGDCCDFGDTIELLTDTEFEACRAGVPLAQWRFAQADNAAPETATA
jgi:hypothetical protein